MTESSSTEITTDSTDAETPVVWDGGRLHLIPEFAPYLREHNLTTFDALYHFQESEVAKNHLKERVTVRIELGTGSYAQAFYLKRHAPARLGEYLKSLIRLRIPLVGAWNEWHKLRAWREISFPTQTPVAYGRSGRHSLLLTLALDGCDKLSELIEHDRNEVHKIAPRRRHELTRSVARLIRRMHDLGWHHQDCYSGHIFIRRSDRQPFLIDLGRVRRLILFKNFWMRKDLAQFAYSVRGCSLADQFRFLRTYWGRPVRRWERRWCRKILRKVRAIGRHSEKHGY